MPDAILDKRLIFVTGKGGVGKSTVALALGLLAARRGKRVVVAELAGNDELQRTFGMDGGERFTEVALAPGLFTISIDPQGAMEEYLKLKLPGPAGAALSQSKIFGVFAMATPGMRELLSIGKVWELSQPDRRTPDSDGYDLVIVDAPASGHGVGLLRTPRTFSEIARVGPIAGQGARIAETIADRGFTGIVAVTTPEEMPVNEIFQVRDELHDDALELDAVIVNCRYPDRFDASEIAAIRGLAGAGKLGAEGGGCGGELGAEAGGCGGELGAALAAAISEHRRRCGQREQEQRLEHELRQSLLHLPYLFVSELDGGAIASLAAELDPQLA